MLSESVGSHYSSRSNFLLNLVYPACDMKLADTRVQLESLCCVKSTTQRNLKHKVPCDRVLIAVDLLRKLSQFWLAVMYQVEHSKAGLRIEETFDL